MDDILQILLALALGYIVTYGMKDREPPTIEINLPTNGYEFRAYKNISVSPKDNKGIKEVTYIIDGEIYHVENSSNPLTDVWNPCELTPGRHTLQVNVSDFAKHTTSSEVITFYISQDLNSDCNGTCDGKARIDDCGVCSGGDSNHEFNSDKDCTDTCFGGAIIDDCGVCSGGKTGIEPNRDKDCNNFCFGGAITDDCGACWKPYCYNKENKKIDYKTNQERCEELDNRIWIGPNHEFDPSWNKDMDCNGDCMGDAIVDKCGICTEGKTGLAKNSNMDCAGVCFGEAYLDECEVCSGGTSNHEENSDKDCTGKCFGKAKIDDCGVCAGGDTNLVKNADMDCAKVCFGEAYLDDCKVCSGGTSNHEANSDKDCNGDCFGKAFIDDCLICSEGKSNHEANIDMDCNGDCSEVSSLWDGALGGTAFLDDCNVCSEGNSGHIPNSDKDCNGDCFGEATIDPCGGCTGGNTGIELNQSPVSFGNKTYTCGDLMFIMEMYKLKYPKDVCSSFDILNNRGELDACIPEYLKLGESRWNTNGRLTQYTLSDDNIKGQYPERAKYATKLTYLDISKNEFWGPFPENFCKIHENGTIRLAGNRFCPPYPECFENNPVLTMDLMDMESIARCKE